MNADLTSLVDERTRELRNLSHHLIEVAENEKRALARELHDELGAMLTALSMDLDLIRRKSEHTAVSDVAQRAAELVASAAMVKRRIMEGLRPSVLDMMGLEEALKSLAGEFSRRTGIVCGVERVRHLGGIDQRTAIALYRIVQEALTNAGKYARASRVDIELRKDDEALHLHISDDGVGVADALTGERRSHGISGMRERVSSLGGSFDIGPASPARGTGVHVRIPVARRELTGGDDAARRALPPQNSRAA